MGQVERSMGCLLLALMLNPDRFQSLDDFDILLQRDGQFDGLRMPVRQAPGFAPAASIAATEIAVRLRSEGDSSGALDHFFEAARLAPGVGEPASNLGQALLELNRPQDALFHCNEGVRLAPDVAETWNHQGNVFHALGRWVEARSSYLEALRLAPGWSIPHNSMGRVLVDIHCPKEALAWFRIASEIDPWAMGYRANIAWVLRELGQLDEAMAVCQGALALVPDSPECHLCLGSIQHDLRQFDESRRSFDEATRLNPGLLLAHQSQGILLSEMGELEAADRSFREILKYQPNHSRALYGLTNIHRGKLPDSDLETIHRVLADPNLSDNSRAELHYGASTVYDGRQEFERSAEHLTQANAIRLLESFRSGRGYRAADHERYVDWMIEVCSVDFFDRVEGFGLSTTRPVFIIGLPRSGTSLTEQILASHSRVYGLGETQMARRHFDALTTKAGSKEADLEYLANIDRETANQIARSHLAQLDAIDDKAALIVDKMPENYLYLGFLATIFPQAKFIHCRRDLRDIAVSCWSTNFWYIDWPHSFDHIASRFAMYQRLMSHWEQVLPSPILAIDYEETVNDIEATARKLLDFCDLDWEPGCIAFHESKRVVRTASLTQVRQPIYRRSLERWRNYEASMGPLFERLEAGIKV
jgi:tetratricopeptide (TPR) repeat protein